MRRIYGSVLASAAVMLLPMVSQAQAAGMEQSKAVANGGISVPGWTGQVDADRGEARHDVNNAKLAKEGNGFT